MNRMVAVPHLVKGAFVLLMVFWASAPVVQAQSLYSDPRAGDVGDVLTVVLVERTSASRASAYQNASNASLGGSSSADGGSINGKFGMDAKFSKDSKNQNESMQRDLLTGTISAVVVGVDSLGNMVVSGERKLNVNGVTHLMRVTGTVRPYDVRNNNTVLSHQLANAFIEYRQDGLARKFFKPGMLTKVGAVAVLAAGIVFASK